MDNIYCALDFETSGLLPGYHEVISVGLALSTYPADCFSSQICPEYFERFDAEAAAVHGLTPRRLRGAPRRDDVADSMISFLRRHVDRVGHKLTPVAHNWTCEAAWLPSLCDCSEIFSPHYVDTMTETRRAGIRPATLAAGLGHFGRVINNHHNALSDAVSCLELWDCLKNSALSDPRQSLVP